MLVNFAEKFLKFFKKALLTLPSWKFSNFWYIS